MQIAIVSDIHANIQAWNSVLLDIRSLDLDEIFCLGDIVGYGPNPAEVLSSVHANANHLVLGNHDAVVCGKLTPELFHDDAEALIRWTAGQLNNKAVSFLSRLPLSIDCGAFRCSHGDLSDPAAFNYISTPGDACPSWECVEGNLFFVGHTHEPSIFILGDSGIPRNVEPQDFIVESDRRYVVNPGSVGQPRDGLALASYCIFDTDSSSVFWRRVPFDLDAFLQAASSAGLNDAALWFLNDDPRKNVTTIRDYADFSPARTPDQKVQGSVETAELDLFRNKAKRWKTSFAVLACAAAITIGTAGTLLHHHVTRELTLPAAAYSADGAYLAELHLHEAPSLPLLDFSVSFGNKRKQHASITHQEDTDILRIESGSTEAILLETPPIKVRPGQKLTLEALLRKSPDFDGSATAFISLQREVNGKPELVPRYLVKEPNMPRRNHFLLAKQTFEIPAGTTHASFGIEACFHGSMDLEQLHLINKE